MPETLENSVVQTEKGQRIVACVAKGLGRWGGLPKSVRMMLAAVALPTLMLFAYLVLWHSPMYESETIFAVRSASEAAAGADLASQIFKTGSSSLQDAQIVDAYLRSPDAFRQLDRKLGLVAHFSDRTKDVVSRLTKNPTADEKRRFWEAIATTTLDTDSGILTFKVRAYSPTIAREISQGILSEAESLVNSMNERSREDTLRLAENEVLVAQNRLADTQRALKNFRDTHRDIDLKSTITGLQGVVMGLEEERAKTSAQLAETASYMNADAPVRRALEARLAALDKQIASQRARLSDSKSDGNLNAQVSEYERLTLDHSFAQKQMTSALGALENARISLLSKTRYLVAIESPTLPDESLYPRVLQFTAVFGLVLLLAYGLVTLVVASVREHMGF